MKVVEIVVIAVLVFLISKLVEWVFRSGSHGTGDPDFNLNDPALMTKPQRTDEVIRIIDRANSLCAVDRVPGRYVRLTDSRYEQLVSMDRNSESDDNE